MFLHYIRSNRASHIVIIPAIGILLWIQSFIHVETTSLSFSEYPMPLYNLLKTYIASLPQLSNSIGLILILLMSYLAFRLNEKHLIVETRSYLPALTIIVLQSSLQLMNILHAGLIASVFVLLAIDKLFDSYKDNSSVTNYFDAGFLLSLGSLFYFSTIYLILALWTGIIVMRKFNFRSWALTLLGVIIPYFLVWSYYYTFGDILTFFNTIEYNISVINKLLSISIADYVLFLFILLLIVIASYKAGTGLQKSKISTRKFMHLLFVFFVFEILITVFVPSADYKMIPLMSIPVTFLLSYYFLKIRSQWFGDIIIVVFTLLLIAGQLLPVFY